MVYYDLMLKLLRCRVKCELQNQGGMAFKIPLDVFIFEGGRCTCSNIYVATFPPSIKGNKYYQMGCSTLSCLCVIFGYNLSIFN